MGNVISKKLPRKIPCLDTTPLLLKGALLCICIKWGEFITSVIEAAVLGFGMDGKAESIAIAMIKELFCVL